MGRIQMEPPIGEDIRDRPYLSHEDIVGLNFIKGSEKYFFRRHYRTGLRSHIMEVLDPMELDRERHGVVAEGLRQYPKARPLKMLRIFRTKFRRIGDAAREIEKVTMLCNYLTSDQMARSDEFLVSYRLSGHHDDTLLCGLQEYVEGEIFDPWAGWNQRSVQSLIPRLQVISKAERPPLSADQWISALRTNAKALIGSLKSLIGEAGHIPDFAGVGNLIITPIGSIKLVDINNIS